jgi:hypothetical protein
LTKIVNNKLKQPLLVADTVNNKLKQPLLVADTVNNKLKQPLLVAALIVFVIFKETWLLRFNTLVV